MYFGNSVVGKVSTVGIGISPTPPQIFTKLSIVQPGIDITYQHKNAIIQARISCRRSNLVKIIPEPSATHITRVQGHKVKQ